MTAMHFKMATDRELLDFYQKYRDELERMKVSSYERSVVERIVGQAEAEIHRRNLQCDEPAVGRRSLSDSRVLRVTASPVRAHKPPR
ncbi:MAG TPA: hypothetical protein VHZ24_06885 [Pirellulales bacterium]|jgi:hypothetical protein|nr:hypothetical protein [Pirellulales bacterium]